MNKHLSRIIMNRKIIVLMKFGSHLYGTNTENSDVDYKGIYMPAKEEILCNRISKSINFSSGDPHEKNTKNDIDVELYSLDYFLKLALKGETVSMDMLHCNDASLIEGSDIWTFINDNRKRFYTRSLKGPVGYCKKQADKYGIKGSRISDARKVSAFLETMMWKFGEMRTMECIWGNLPAGEHIRFVKGSKRDSKEVFYQVCDKKMQKTARISYCKRMLDAFIEGAGHRALQAEKNEGIDWKAVSHAIRYAWQIRDLFTTGDIVFPLKDGDFLKEIKRGNLDYTKEVAPILENIMEEIEFLSKKQIYQKR